MSSRDKILAKLRAGKSPFDDAPARPKTYAPVTRVEGNDPQALLARFTAEVERLTGKVYDVADVEAAIQTVLDIIGTDKSILAWDNLPLPGLTEALDGAKIKRIVPRARQENRSVALRDAEPIRVGVTGADAAFATTGTLALLSGDKQGRLPSLLPPVHIALLRRDRLFPRLEDWISAEGRDVLVNTSSVAFITGPSRTSDIEMHTILGVHGPGVVHVIMV